MGTPDTGFRSAGIRPRTDERREIRNSRIFQSFRLLGGLLFIGIFVLFAIVLFPFAGRTPKRRLIGKGSRQNSTPDLFEYSDWDYEPDLGYYVDFVKN